MSWLVLPAALTLLAMMAFTLSREIDLTSWSLRAYAAAWVLLWAAFMALITGLVGRLGS